jgi:hypothetical protein
MSYSHLAMRLGDLIHFHPFAHRPATQKTTRNECTSARVVVPRSATLVESRSATLPDDLAYFSLSVQHRTKDRRADLDRLGLIGPGDADLQEID